MPPYGTSTVVGQKSPTHPATTGVGSALLHITPSRLSSPTLSSPCLTPWVRDVPSVCPDQHSCFPPGQSTVPGMAPRAVGGGLGAHAARERRKRKKENPKFSAQNSPLDSSLQELPATTSLASFDLGTGEQSHVWWLLVTRPPPPPIPPPPPHTAHPPALHASKQLQLSPCITHQC